MCVWNTDRQTPSKVWSVTQSGPNSGGVRKVGLCLLRFDSPRTVLRWPSHFSSDSLSCNHMGPSVMVSSLVIVTQSSVPEAYHSPAAAGRPFFFLSLGKTEFMSSSSQQDLTAWC